MDGIQASGIHFYIYHEGDRECVYIYVWIDTLVGCVCMSLTIQKDDHLELKRNYSYSSNLEKLHCIWGSCLTWCNENIFLRLKLMTLWKIFVCLFISFSSDWAVWGVHTPLGKKTTEVFLCGNLNLCVIYSSWPASSSHSVEGGWFHSLQQETIMTMSFFLSSVPVCQGNDLISYRLSEEVIQWRRIKKMSYLLGPVSGSSNC